VNETRYTATRDDVMSVLADPVVRGHRRPMGVTDIDRAIAAHLGGKPPVRSTDSYCNLPRLRAEIARMVEEGLLAGHPGTYWMSIGVRWPGQSAIHKYFTTRQRHDAMADQWDRSTSDGALERAQEAARRDLAQLRPQQFAYLVSKHLEKEAV
jgi:hypothetical protein